jgi:hypothetical protein
MSRALFYYKNNKTAPLVSEGRFCFLNRKNGGMKQVIASLIFLQPSSFLSWLLSLLSFSLYVCAFKCNPKGKLFL